MKRQINYLRTIMNQFNWVLLKPSFQLPYKNYFIWPTFIENLEMTKYLKPGFEVANKGYLKLHLGRRNLTDSFAFFGFT